MYTEADLEDFRAWVISYLTTWGEDEDQLTPRLCDLVSVLCDDDADEFEFKGRLIARVADRDDQLIHALYQLKTELRSFERRRNAA